MTQKRSAKKEQLLQTAPNKKTKKKRKKREKEISSIPASGSSTVSTVVEDITLGCGVCIVVYMRWCAW